MKSVHFSRLNFLLPFENLGKNIKEGMVLFTSVLFRGSHAVPAYMAYVFFSTEGCIFYVFRVWKMDKKQFINTQAQYDWR